MKQFEALEVRLIFGLLVDVAIRSQRLRNMHPWRYRVASPEAGEAGLTAASCRPPQEPSTMVAHAWLGMGIVPIMAVIVRGALYFVVSSALIRSLRGLNRVKVVKRDMESLSKIAGWTTHRSETICGLQRRGRPAEPLHIRLFPRTILPSQDQ